MQPKFKDNQAYQQAEMLMQPAFIRVIDNIRKQSELSDWVSSYEEISEPYPSYLLCLKKGDTNLKFNLWELCFKICFVDYNSQQDNFVEIDQSLFSENGDIEWQNLEMKTQTIVKTIFEPLPNAQ
jgi:hypothetical protein